MELIAAYEQIITDLSSNDYSIQFQFLDEYTLSLLATQLDRKIEEEHLRLAGIGMGAEFDKNKAIRSDKIQWIANDTEILGEQLFLKKMEHFAQYLNHTCYTGIQNQEFHYAVYESGTFYKRHLDQFKTDDSRKFSVITYLNRNWQKADGGQLILFIKGKEIVIAPTWGFTIFLKSDVIEHEVKLSHKKRLSITGWLR